MSYAAEVLVSGETKFAGNAVRLATREQAEAYAKDLMWRWLAVREWRVVESEDPVNYAFVPGNGLTPVAEEKAS